MKPSPGLIPHSEFHLYSWLQSARRPSWYYFKKKQNRNIISNGNFIESVDEPLKELVTLLHKKGIKTTPSCSGHHLKERNLEKIYEELEEDCGIIRTDGLYLKDVETGACFLYKDKNYYLPWGKNIFLEKVEVYQQKGVLGIRFGNRKKIREQVLKMQIENVKTKERDSISFIFTGGGKDHDIKSTWLKITNCVKQMFERELTAV